MMQKKEHEAVGWGEILVPGYIIPLALVCFGIWLHASDELIVATMMPAIVREIGGAEFLAWTLALYEIGSIIAGASAALITLRLGIRAPMGFSAVIFGIGCAVSAIADHMMVVLAGRLLQGLGGGALLAMAYIAVGIFFPSRLTARVIGALSALWGLAAFSGPLIGGLFVEYSTWRGGFWFFAMQAWLLAAWIFFAVDKNIGKTESKENQSVPFRRLMLLVAAIVMIAYSGITKNEYLTIGLIFLGSVCLWQFFRLDSRKGGSRLFPRNAISIFNPVGAILSAIMIFSIASVPIVIYGPVLMTMLHDVSELTAGYVLAGGAIGWAITAILLSGSPEKNDRILILSGAIVITISVMGLVYAVAQGPVWLIAVFSTMQGAGFGIAWTFILRKAADMSEADENERVASAIPTMQRIGYALGAAFIGIIANFSGFDMNANEEEIRTVSIAVFAATVPVAFFALYSIILFIRAIPR